MCVCVCVCVCECMCVSLPHIFSDYIHSSCQTLNKFIEKEINPYVDEWEKAHAFPAHEVSFKCTTPQLCNDNLLVYTTIHVLF